MAKKDTSPRLGRGLAALLGDQAPQLARTTRANAPVQQHTSLPIDVLEPSPFQPRRDMNPERLEELANSIRSRGVLQPLLVRPDPANPERYQIIAGERRWRASQLAGLHSVPVHVRQLDDTDAMAAALVENLQRADLNPIEEAEGLQRLINDYTLTQEELAGAVGKSRPHITNTMRLLNLPAEVRAHVRQGELTAGHARALLGHPDPAAAARIVLEKGLNVRQTEALVAEKSEKKPASKSRRDAEIVQIEEDLALRLGLKVRISYDGKKGGSLKIDYRSLEQFESLMRLLNQS
ncbi:chromosome partitioning nuclease protein ParB [Gluconobacter thailandicus F149-1 = NBRC 100600]|uniref:Chromosome partitioning protein ParB n=2 Tax=Gluconobacter thailandicus TaxID=257438 RepID=A0ABQ0IXZ2_GLUTH|nr:ParB/RepB/Spo0J family partition protein [Gluconobacter thailandicus]GAC87795.1 chromosome partitioning protein ParB [Gluconobacter thailandicus NBRC 3255]GAD26373.1 chromosome partitioning protein ParB [Gluconobacter thailandicus NBRC 3257]GAN92916.1 chromosome partitioning nuclease protein ParB [Gluconobacter thailandicus F149-1 = NBRC 100600]GEL87535.1 chromosome partitioning protein ParB [Gluconobacter thailandicus F149-1 = NBRC 100600]